MLNRQRAPSKEKLEKLKALVECKLEELHDHFALTIVSEEESLQNTFLGPGLKLHNSQGVSQYRSQVFSKPLSEQRSAEEPSKNFFSVNEPSRGKVVTRRSLKKLGELITKGRATGARAEECLSDWEHSPREPPSALATSAGKSGADLAESFCLGSANFKKKPASGEKTLVYSFRRPDPLEFSSLFLFRKLPFPPTGPSFAIRDLRLIFQKRPLGSEKPAEAHPVFALQCGLLYQGGLRFGKMEGLGRLLLQQRRREPGPSADVEDKLVLYLGEFRNGFVEGKGLVQFCNGSFFEGRFKEGVAHGVGKFLAKDGREIASGTWIDGKFVN